MSNAVMMERTGMGMPALTMPGMGTTPLGSPTGGTVGPGWMMVPRCTVKVEKCSGGLKMTCSCDDKMACGMVQNLCAMLAGGAVSCCLTMNGLTVCCCNLTMGFCKCETTETGVCLTCTSGDAKCCEMIQACCECMAGLIAAGCSCCVMMSGTPVCCGCCEPTTTTKAAKR